MLAGGGTGVSANWWKFGSRLNTYVTDKKLNLDTLNTIESYNDNNPKRAAALIKMIQEWPEVTPELFIKSLYQCLLERLAIDLGKIAGIDPSQPYSVPASRSSNLIPEQRHTASASVPQQQSNKSFSSNTLKSFLNGLSYEDRQDLEQTLATGTPARWNDLAVELSKHVTENKLNISTINHIRAYYINDPQRVIALLKMLQEWPEITPQVFIQGLEKAKLGRLSQHLGRLIGINPPQPQYSTPAFQFYNSNPEPQYTGYAAAPASQFQYFAPTPEPVVAPPVRKQPEKPKNALDQNLGDFLNNRLLLRGKVVSELGKSISYGAQDWRGVAAALQNTPEFQARVTRQWISSIEVNHNTDPKRGEAFLSGFTGFRHSSVRNFVKALAQFGHYQNLCKAILIEANCPEYLDELIGFSSPQNQSAEGAVVKQSANMSSVTPTYGAGLYDKPHSVSVTIPSIKLVGKLGELCSHFFNSRLLLRNEVVSELAKDNAWHKVITVLALQPSFQGKFKPNPVEWCEGIESNYGYDKYRTSEAIFENFGGFLNSTVATLVTAIAASDSKYQHLCKKICEAAGAPNAVNDLAFDVDLYQEKSYRM